MTIYLQYNKITGVVNASNSIEVPAENFPSDVGQLAYDGDLDISVMRINPETLKIEEIPQEEKSAFSIAMVSLDRDGNIIEFLSQDIPFGDDLNQAAGVLITKITQDGVKGQPITLPEGPTMEITI